MTLHILPDVPRNVGVNRPNSLRPSGGESPPAPIDPFGRRIDYLRISITDRCNLRCVYCMPENGIPLSPRHELLSFEETWRVAGAARRLGFKKFRITGGEPLVVRDCLTLIAGIREATSGALLALTTNGVLLEQYAEGLRDAGVSRLNISLDTLDAERFAKLARRDGLDSVLRAIDLALTLGFEKVKLNAVIVAGCNEQDLCAIAGLAETRPIDIRFIERMPLDHGGEREFVGYAPMLDILRTRYELLPVSPDHQSDAAHLLFSAPALRGRIGFIAPRTGKFCAACNRLRLTPKGEIKGCLLTEGTLDLRTPMRSGISDAQLEALLLLAIRNKPLEYNDGNYGLERTMNAIGG